MYFASASLLILLIKPVLFFRLWHVKCLSWWRPRLKWHKAWCVDPWGILQLCCSLKEEKKSRDWRYQKDNPELSQIFIGTEPLMGNQQWDLKAAMATLQSAERDLSMICGNEAPSCIQNMTQSWRKKTCSLVHTWRICRCDTNTSLQLQDLRP